MDGFTISTAVVSQKAAVLSAAMTDGRSHVLLTVDLDPDVQDRALGTVGVHLEWNDQSSSGYDLIRLDPLDRERPADRHPPGRAGRLESRQPSCCTKPPTDSTGSRGASSTRSRSASEPSPASRSGEQRRRCTIARTETMKNFLTTMICGFITIPAITALALNGNHVLAGVLAAGGLLWLTVDTWRLWRLSR